MRIRDLAATEDDPGLKQKLLELAEQYDKLARRAVDRASKSPPDA